MTDNSAADITIEDFNAGLTNRLNQFHAILEKKKVFTNPTEFTALVGLTVQAASQLLNGSRHLTGKQLFLLSTNTGLNINWYLTGRGEVFIHDDNKTDQPQLTSRIAKAVNYNEMDEELGLEIIDQLSYNTQVENNLRIENQDLAKKLIEVMARVQKFTKG